MAQLQASKDTFNAYQHTCALVLRSKEYLKVKNFEDAEFVVTGVETSKMAVKDETRYTTASCSSYRILATTCLHQKLTDRDHP